ncbi:response regulator [Sphingorhabdus sp. SMR4y]|uniref:response regulator n=1 Tax=Sphingorhabdus sp. SMR4y TaxID=2584094 RepID=UPI000B5D049E|nr:response regulator transcription factor [Sphingorhabdus sp. SMR4y]ASK88416.1 DNA-binding response regulator [Sphingorhabdus sp. SMR4y]
MIKLLLVDDHPIFLDGLKQFVESHDGFEVLCAKSAEEAAVLMDNNQFDLLLLDITIIGGGGMDILRSLNEAGSTVPVIFLTVHITPQDTVEALKLDVRGIILKESAPSEIMDCITMVLNGGTYFDRGVTERALQHSVDTPSHRKEALDSLTAREREIVSLVSRGLKNREIAVECGLTEGTVKTHLHNIFGKMAVKSRTQLLIALGKVSDDDFI